VITAVSAGQPPFLSRPAAFVRAGLEQRYRNTG
jgi:hypothetical protein